MTAQTEHPPTPNAAYESCEECGALLDPQQRYCVHCAARRGNGANPSSQYFAAMSKRAQRPLARPPARAGSGKAAAVAFFALLPIAVAIGVVVGRSDGGGSDDALLQALREGNTAVAAGSASSAPAPVARDGPKVEKGKGGKGKSGAKVVAKTENGTVHQVTGFEPTVEKTEEDTKIVESNVKQAGATYIKAQQNLPDVVVVGGDPDSAPPMPSGKGQP